ncbi:MAG: hypothetical protein ACRD01_09545 [Terriglobales bacterium]
MVSWLSIGMRTVRRERDHALVRAVQLESRLEEATARAQRLERDVAAANQALERVVDNALFAAGAAPVFHPEDRRFQPRPAAEQEAEAQRLMARPGMTSAEWRRKVEEQDRELAERERKAAMAVGIKQVAEERRKAAKTPLAVSH